MKKRNIVVWFSLGAPSAVAAKLTIKKYGKRYNVIVANNTIDEEDPDNRRFLKDIEAWIGQPVINVINEKVGHTSAERIWIDRRYMSGVKGAPCTSVLKREARYEYEKKVNISWHVFGYTKEEKIRHEDFIKYERSNVIPVLIDEDINRQDCFDIIEGAGIKLPQAYYDDFPNANCIGCVKATSPTYWNHVRKKRPDVFKRRAELSRELGCRLVRYKGKRIFLDELPEDAIGRPMKSMKKIECGIFCPTFK